MKNEDVRNAAKANSIKLWEIADALGIRDSEFSRRLRHELSDDEKKRIFNVIDELAKA